MAYYEFIDIPDNELSNKRAEAYAELRRYEEDYWNAKNAYDKINEEIVRRFRTMMDKYKKDNRNASL